MPRPDMPSFQFSDPRAVIYLAGGLLGLLISVLATSRGLIPEGQAAPARRAVAHWLPIAITAILATVFGHLEIAMGIAFGTSVAVLSSVTGFVVLSGPVEHMPPAVRRVWPFLIVPVMLVFLLGFRGFFVPFDAALLLFEGLLCLVIWGRWREEEESAEPQAARGGIRLLGIVETIGGGIMALVAGYAAIHGAIDFARADVHFPTTVMGATLFSVVLALPMISSGVSAATHGRAYAALSGQVGVVFLNLGALLPTIILIASGQRFMAQMHAQGAAATQPAAAITVLYPRVSWRVDAIALLILALVFMAAADRRLKLSKEIAGVLIFAYLVYLLLVMYTTHMMT